MAEFFGADLDDTFLRIEYAVDATGFWLEPHTDLGVKRLTILHYISDVPGQEDCGTDIYNADKTRAKRTPFENNLALAFVPGRRHVSRIRIPAYRGPTQNADHQLRHP